MTEFVKTHNESMEINEGNIDQFVFPKESISKKYD